MNLSSLLSQSEGTNFDLKERLLVVENASHRDHAKHLGRFVKAVVALANFARLSGQDAYLVFGVGDLKRDFALKPTNGIGILDQSAITSDRLFWPRDDTAAFLRHWETHVLRPYERIIQSFVCPQGYLRYSLTHEHHDGAVLAVLKVFPLPTERPFNAERFLELGLASRYYVRVNDKSTPLEDELAEQVLTRWTDQPYLPPAVWKKYLTGLRTEVSNAFPDNPSEVNAYQDIYLETLDQETVIEFRELWRRISNSDASSSQFVVFFGEPGTGKTLCLKRSVFEQAAVTWTELDNDAKLLEPQSWIPVYVPLDSYDGNQDLNLVVANRISEVLARSGERETSIDAGLLSARQLRFIVAIDAVDEIPKTRIEEGARKIDAFAKAHTATNHAVTSRETRCPVRWKHSHSAYRVRPLSQDQIHSYLGSRIGPERLESTRLTLLLDELALLICIPRLLHSFLTYLEQSPVPNAGMAVREILEAIWQLEDRLSRGWSGSVDHYRRPLRDYAKRCIEEDVAGLNEDEDHGLSQDDLHWYHNAGILKLSGVRWPYQISFAHIEYLDSLNAQTLLLTEARPSPAYRQLGERIRSALLQHPERGSRTVRYLMNMVDADISLPPWSQWTPRITDSISRLRVIAERRRPEFANVSVLEEVVRNMDEPSVDRDLLVYWLNELLQDPNPQIVGCVLENIGPTVLSLVDEQVITLMDRSVFRDLRRLAARRLLEAQLASDRPELFTAIKDWLKDHREPGHVEYALDLVGDFQLTWANDTVYEVATNDLLYSYGLRFYAAEVLSQLADPSSAALVELIGQHQQISDTEAVVDDVRAEDFQTTLLTVTSEPPATEDDTISQEEL